MMFVSGQEISTITIMINDEHINAFNKPLNFLNINFLLVVVFTKQLIRTPTIKELIKRTAATINALR